MLAIENIFLNIMNQNIDERAKMSKKRIRQLRWQLGAFVFLFVLLQLFFLILIK